MKIFIALRDAGCGMRDWKSLFLTLIYELRNGPHSPESLWRRSEVRFLMGTQNYLLLPRSRQDEN